MKKIDFHIHTISTDKDGSFEFSIENLGKYISQREIDAIAITNHNVFDISQFNEIQGSIDAKVFPGIEIDVEKGHILVICSHDKFGIERIRLLSENLKDKFIDTKYISLELLIKLCSNPLDYLFIPHIEGKPKSLSLEVIKEFPQGYIYCGEVPNQSKFNLLKKDKNSSLTPVFFSDSRISKQMLIEHFSLRQTYLNIEALEFDTIKAALKDRSKVYLDIEGTDLFDATGEGDFIYPGINVITGKRSTGKTVLLKKMYAANENVKYIRQFELVQNQDDEEKSIEEFQKEVKLDEQKFIENHLNQFKDIASTVALIDLQINHFALDKYIESLHKFANDTTKKNSYAKTKLFSEEKFVKLPDSSLKSSIEAIITLLENMKKDETLKKYLSEVNFNELLKELVSNFRKEKYNNKIREYVNEILDSVQPILQSKSDSPIITNYDQLLHMKNLMKVHIFNKLVKSMKESKIISSTNIGNFSIRVTRNAIDSAATLKKKIKKPSKVTHIFELYDKPYDYLIKMSNEGLANDVGIEKAFFDFQYDVLNKYGNPVSGGERSEFRLMRALKDAYSYQMLLIDEPESSFDNMFLREEINKTIKEMSEYLPVVIVTHNHTVGLSIKPDYIFHLIREDKPDGSEYYIFSGCPDAANLSDKEGKIIKNYIALMNSFESGEKAYEERKVDIYDVVKNRG